MDTKVVFVLSFITLLRDCTSEPPSRKPIIGVATDPNEHVRIGVASDPGAEGYEAHNPHEKPDPAEISSPARSISPEKNPLLDEGNTDETESNEVQEVEDASSQSGYETSDPQATENEGTSTPQEVNPYEAIILSVMGMKMNHSRMGNLNSSIDFDGASVLNCTDLSCLYGTQADEESTTQSSPVEENATPDTEVSAQHPRDQTVPRQSLDTPHEFIIFEKHHPLASNRTGGRSNVDEPTSNDDDEDLPTNFFFPERARSSNDRSLILGPVGPVVPPAFETPSNHSRQSNTTSSKKELKWVFDNARIIPGYNTTREIEQMDVPDIVPLLRRCGVFAACSLELTAAGDVINNDAHAYEKYFPGQITSRPDFMSNVLKVTCDPTYVSIIIAFAIVLAIVIVVSNVVIVIVTLRTKALRKPHGYFKISLAVADLINGAFVLPSICSNMIRNIHFNDDDRTQILQMRDGESDIAEANFFGICTVLSQIATVYSLLLLSIDSFLSIRWPMQYRVGDLMTARRSWGLIALTWFIAVAVSALPLVAHSYVRYSLSYATFSYLPHLRPLDETITTPEDAFLKSYIHVILYMLLVWAIPLFATWLLTLLTAYYSRGMLKSMSSARKKGPGGTKKFDRLQRDILRTVTIVLLMVTVAVLPITICFILIGATAYDNKLCLERQVTDFLFGSYYVLVCGSFVNVIVYNACNKEFRRSTFDFLCDILNHMCTCCGFRLEKSGKSFKGSSGPGTRRTTVSSESRKNRLNSTSSGKNWNAVSVTGPKAQTSIPMEVQSNSGGFYTGVYGRASDHSDSIGSDAPSSSRTVSTVTSSSSSSTTSLSSSSRNRSIGSESSSTSNTRVSPPRKIPAQRAASCSSTFGSSTVSARGQYYYGR